MANTPGLAEIGRRIRRAREIAGDLSARELSLLAAQSHSLVGHYERGMLKDLNTSTLSRIAAVLGVSLDWLALGRGSEPTPEVVAAAVAAARSVHQGRPSTGTEG